MADEKVNELLEQMEKGIKIAMDSECYFDVKQTDSKPLPEICNKL